LVCLAGFLLLACAPLQSKAQNLELPGLGYEYEALEPHFDAETMKLHHLRHHAAYLTTLNNALSALRGAEETKHLAKMGVDKLLQNLDSVPEPYKTQVRNGGGGFVNHALFWSILAPNGTKLSADSGLEKQIEKEFGSFDTFVQTFKDQAVKVFGSGWAWLSVAKESGALVISKTANQDTPAMETALIPILGLDVWEHAYYLKYQNKRADYIDAFFNIVNWEEVSRRYEEALKKKDEL